MNENWLLDELKSTPSKKRVLELADRCLKENFSIPLLIDLTFNDDKKVRFRTAWILEQVYLKDPNQFTPHLSHFLERFSEQDYPSAQRHFSKILLELTKGKMMSHHPALITYSEQLIETVFSWLIEEKTPVAVKAHCLSILANYSSSHSWVKEELLKTIDFMEARESIAFYARAQGVREKLKVGKSGSREVGKSGSREVRKSGSQE